MGLHRSGLFAPVSLAPAPAPTPFSRLKPARDRQDNRITGPAGSARGSWPPAPQCGRIGTSWASAKEPTPERNGRSSPCGERGPSGNQTSMQSCSSAAAPSVRLLSGLRVGSTGSTRRLRLNSGLQGRSNSSALAPPQQVVRRRLSSSSARMTPGSSALRWLGVSRQAPEAGMCSVPLAWSRKGPCRSRPINACTPLANQPNMTGGGASQRRSLAASCVFRTTPM